MASPWRGGGGAGSFSPRISSRPSACGGRFTPPRAGGSVRPRHSGSNEPPLARVRGRPRPSAPPLPVSRLGLAGIIGRRRALMHTRTVALFLAALAATVGFVQAQPTQPQPTGIEHKAVACIVVAKYPKLKACFGAEVVEPRAYFHAEGVHDWFWVKMAKDAKDAPEPGCYAGILPK